MVAPARLKTDEGLTCNLDMNQANIPNVQHGVTSDRLVLGHTAPLELNSQHAAYLAIFPSAWCAKSAECARTRKRSRRTTRILALAGNILSES